MMNKQPTIEEAIEAVTCPGCMTIPISHLQFEAEVPISGSWQALFDELNIKTVVDPAGRAAIVVPAARKLFQHLRRQTELAVEGHDRMFAKLAAERPSMAGFPALEGASAMESLFASPGYRPMRDEFPGRPKPDFLREELAAGQRADDEKKREAEAKAKDRLAKRMNDRLGGKR